jgi:hypothetical protein
MKFGCVFAHVDTQGKGMLQQEKVPVLQLNARGLINYAEAHLSIASNKRCKGGDVGLLLDSYPRPNAMWIT